MSHDASQTPLEESPPVTKPSDGVVADTLREFAWCTLGGAVLGAIALSIAGAIWFGMSGLIIGLIAGLILGAVGGVVFFVWVNGLPFL